MCINRVFYGTEAINHIEQKRQMFYGQWMTEKEMRKVKKISMWKISKESFDMEALSQFVNLEVLEISGVSESNPIKIKNMSSLYEMKNLKCVQFECCNLGEELDTSHWKKLKTLELCKCRLNILKIGKNKRLKKVVCEKNTIQKEQQQVGRKVYHFYRKEDAKKRKIV